MLEIFFFTSNRTKLAHFKYLGRKVGIRVRGFKEISYYATYKEPRTNDRAQLLQESYRSALSQWTRWLGHNADEHIFFLEDTSVRIDALSKKREYPGLDVKYWMRKTSFKKLDKTLKESGNNRKVIVRSDIVAHIPKKWKQALSLSLDYLWVFGETHGRITDNNEAISPNLVYPWLDDKSFNKWFVPDGENIPISALKIEAADNSDFRAVAFFRFVEFLNKAIISTKPEPTQFQYELPSIPKPASILLICGPTCSGKTTAAGWISANYGIPHLEASDFMRKAFWERHGLRAQASIGDFAEAALETQPGIVSELILEHLSQYGLDTVVVTGFRSPKELKALETGLASRHCVRIIFLDAPYETRFERAKARAREPTSERSFDTRNAQESRMGILEFKNLDGVECINNACSIENLITAISSSVASEQNLMTRGNRGRRPRHELETLILSVLYKIAPQEKWLTTTEIATHLRDIFGLTKSKNNVSRYFNQEFHPFYSARIRETGSRALEYRLSATGLSEAKIIEQENDDQTNRSHVSKKNGTSTQNQFKLEI